ncbi:MAG: transporter substrate-binding domain-containing protein, partial [Eubacteriales bacterium]|nr:transporter substrate-binding domain-containing protein [Eubacteriales bacterium]
MKRQCTNGACRAVAALLAVLLAVAAAPAAFAQQSSGAREVVRVGYFLWDGYQMQDETGVRSGYGYDFLKMAENYNNWKYEYTGGDTSWEESLQMLEKGEVDLITFASKTEERLKLFDYSENPIGT